MVMSCNIATCNKCNFVTFVTKAARLRWPQVGKKAIRGPRFRRIRQQLGLSQTQIAEGLGISPSYINLIERNQRPVTAQLLMRLAQTYDLDLRDLASADEDRFFAELNEISPIRCSGRSTCRNRNCAISPNCALA